MLRNLTSDFSLFPFMLAGIFVVTYDDQIFRRARRDLMKKEKKSKQVNSLDKPGVSRWALYLLILSSGAAGLIYEVVWARQLTLFIGITAIANAAVLTAFMLGLASGSLVLGRSADAIARPLRLYALLEILIGCYGATTPWAIWNSANQLMPISPVLSG